MLLHLSGAKACKSCRSRQELSNEYLLAKIGVDTAENEHLKVWRKFNSIFIRLLTRDRDRTFAALDVAVDALVRNCFLAENYRSVVGKAQLQSADSYSFHDRRFLVSSLFQAAVQSVPIFSRIFLLSEIP